MKLLLGSLTVITLLVSLCEGAHDVDEKELEFIAHHLSVHECRQLIEALHSDQMFLDELPDGSHAPSNRSCIDMLNTWDQKDSRKESFVRLVERLRELGKQDLAKKVSRAVFKDREEVVEELLLHRKGSPSPNIDQEEVISLHRPADTSQSAKDAHIKDFDGRSDESKSPNSPSNLPKWTTAQTVLVVISSLCLLGLFGFWFVSCCPDCCRSLCEICRRKPHANSDDAAHFLLSELDDGDV